MDVLSNFARVLSLEVDERKFECVALRIGPTDVSYNYLVVDGEGEEAEMIAPSATVDYRLMAVVERMFQEPDNDSLKKQALKIWNQVAQALQ